jgi:uncharacterized membrane protein YgcG
MPGIALQLAQSTPPPAPPAPVAQLRSGFTLLIILIALGVALIVIALGLTMANRRSYGRRVKKRHPGPKVDAWKEAGARARTPTAWELEKTHRPRKHKGKKPLDPDAFQEGLESGGDGSSDLGPSDSGDSGGSGDGGGGEGGGDGGGE